MVTLPGMTIVEELRRPAAAMRISMQSLPTSRKGEPLLSF